MSLSTYHRIVVKIGSNVLTDDQSQPDLERIAHLVEQVAWLRSQGAEVVLVSSGAVAMGRSTLPQLSHVNPVLRRQVWASVGQPRLMQIYQQLFEARGANIAQLLVTKEDFRDREHYLNMKACLQGLLRDEIVPIINENDAVAVTELMFTDNDELAGLVAAAVNADALVILSNVAGIYDGHPNDPKSQLIRVIDPNDGQFQRYILPSTSSFGRGGMNTKYRIARKAAVLGVHTIIANGKRENILHEIWNQTGEYTLFPSQKKTSNLKKRLAYQGAETKGKIFINEGAAHALRAAERISSLLPVGVSAIEGNFERGDIVSICCGEIELGIGMVQYGSTLARKYMGQKGKKPLIHYDYLLIG